MTAEDVLATTAEHGVAASGLALENNDVLMLLRIFNKDLLAEIRDDDAPGVMAPTYLFRSGKRLGGGVAAVVGDRALFGWMKGLLKKPTIAVVPLSSITSAKRDVKVVGGHAKPTPVIIVSADEDWELLPSPDVPAEAPLYTILTDLLTGAEIVDEFPAGPPEAAS